MRSEKLFPVMLVCMLCCAPAFATRVIGKYTPIFEGIEYAGGWDTSPRIMVAYAMRVDLQNPNVQFYATPQSGPYETTRQSPPDFLSSYGLKAAINANYSDSIGSYSIIHGLLISNGSLVSGYEAYPFNSQLLFTSTNVASLVEATSNPSGIYTAVGGAEFVLREGAILDWTTDLHPRTGMGLSEGNRFLIIVVIDGRQPGYSEGCTYRELAQWLIDFGAYDGVNFDGGGSSCLARDNNSGNAMVLNSPSDGTPRLVGSNLGMYSVPLPFSDKYVYNDFESGEGTFFKLPSASGSTTGISTSSAADLATEAYYQGNYSQKLTIVDNTGVSGGWFVRHLSGSSATRSQNIARPTNGYIGFWAKTATPNLQISIAIDDTNNVTADKGVYKPIVSDGQWHLYEWNLEDNSQWVGWVNGDGIIDTADFTIDSIQILSSADQNAVIYLDNIVHHNRGSIVYWDSMFGDYEPDGNVDLEDFAMLADHWLLEDSDAGWDRIYDMDAARDGQIGLADIVVFVQNWLVNQAIVGHWKFDETTGLTAYDSSNLGRNGTLVNGPVWTSSGKFDGALEFDGTDDYVQAAGYKGITGTADRSVCAWIRTDKAGGQILAWGNISASGGKWEVRVDGSHVLALGVNGGFIKGTADIMDNNWHHIAVVFANDGMPTVSDARLYVDGVLDTTSALLEQPVNTVADTDLEIGRSSVSSSGSVYFRGTIDDVRIYSRALSAGQVAGVASKEAHWKFDDGQGGTAVDASGYGRNGTLINGPVWTSGKFNGALQFDGADDYVQAAGYKGITGTASRSVTAWIRKSDSTSTNGIIEWGDGVVDGDKWEFRLTTGQQLLIQVGNGYIRGVTTVGDGNWHHVAAVFAGDSTPAVSDIKLYVDGFLDGTTAMQDRAINTTSGIDVQIGRSTLNSDGARYMHGDIDDLRIYKSALSAEQVQDIMFGR